MENFISERMLIIMMKIKKTNKIALLMSNIVGMISGMMLGIAGAILLTKYQRNQKTLKNRAKKAFKAIENTISL